MTFDELEFAISQYLDGTLPAAQVAELEARLAVDLAARELLDEYRQLDSVLKQQSSVPEIQWDRLADHLSATVAADSEQIEFAAIEYVDGAMASQDAAAFASRAAEPHVEQLVASHRKLHGALKALPKPNVHWNKLAEHLYDHSVGANRTIKLDAFRWVRVAGGLAVAACVMIVTALGVRQHLNDGHQSDHRSVASRMEIQIDGAEQASPKKQLAVAEISIGGNDNVDAAEGIVVSDTPHSLVAVSTPVAQDLPMPY